MILKCLLGLIFVSFVTASPRGLLGTKECSWGQSHWCKNLTNAKNCHAVKHCIQTVWVHQTVPVDEDDICTLCKHMVQDARDQLESNETKADIKNVFEGTCKLFKIKPIVKTCMKFADEYAPELADILSSQMNPDVICTLAGLCNSQTIDKMLENLSVKEEKEKERVQELQKDCEACMDFGDVISNKIERATLNDMKVYLMDKCRSLGSLSDACSNLVDEYSNDIYNKLKRDFTPAAFCYLTSSCVNGYGRKIQVKTESDVGVIQLNNDALSVAVKHLSEDQTCELCKSVVNHLRDVLTSNTTEIEFKQMLKGICKQMGKFRSECLSLADEYYDSVYRFIMNDLDGRELCSFAGICPKTGVYVNGPIAPLLPEGPAIVRPKEEPKIGRVSVVKPDSGVQVFTPALQMPSKVEISFGDPIGSKFQLPIQRVLVVPQKNDLEVNNREACIFCQYFLHYVQKVISQPYGENALKNVVEKACNELPSSVTLQCKNFVEQFGDAFVAILAQEIDPSQVCPSLHICPARVLQDKYEELEIVGKPGCPLCLMAIEDITEKLKDNKTEESIRHALHGLCLRMPKNLKSQCDEFVHDYTQQIMEMILANFTPQEVCTFLKLCHANDDVELTVANGESPLLSNKVGNLEAKQIEPAMCYLCEFVMDRIITHLQYNHTEEDVKRVVMNVCSTMPRLIETDCEEFVERYSTYVIDMLNDGNDPSSVCLGMHMCREPKPRKALDIIHRAVEECALCEALIGAVRGLLEDKDFDRDLSSYGTQICSSIPHLRPDQVEKCQSMILSYGPSIINLLVEFEVRPSLVCPRLGLCDRTEQAKVEMEESTPSNPQVRPHLVGGNKCTWGPSYWCQSEDHAKECNTLAHCREVVWKADKPSLEKDAL